MAAAGRGAQQRQRSDGQQQPFPGPDALPLLCTSACWDRLFPPDRAVVAADVLAAAGRLPPDLPLQLQVRDTVGDHAGITRVARLPLAFAPQSEGEDAAAVGRRRLAAAGLALSVDDGRLRIDAVRAASPAGRLGLTPSVEVTGVRVPVPQPSPHWRVLPAVLAAGWVVAAVLRRASRRPSDAP